MLFGLYNSVSAFVPFVHLIFFLYEHAVILPHTRYLTVQREPMFEDVDLKMSYVHLLEPFHETLL